MLYYVPPLVPVMGRSADGIYEHAGNPAGIFHALENARLPIRYLASLFSAGNSEIVASSLRKLMAVRWYRRSLEIADADPAAAARVLAEAGLTAEQANDIYRLTALSTLEERFVLPPLQREEALSSLGPDAAEECRQNCGLGEVVPIGRGA
jgi:nitrate reductase beta subunit